MLGSEDFKEKRASKRFAVSIPLTCCDTFGNMTHAHTHDISAEGAGIITNGNLGLGSAVEIFFQMPDNGQKIYRKARVIWVTNTDSGIFRAGIQLKDSILNPVPLVLRTINCRYKN